METIVAVPEIRLLFGRKGTTCQRHGAEALLDLAVPVLCGPDEEVFVTGRETDTLEAMGPFQVLRSADGEVRAGIAALSCHGLGESVAYELYRHLLEITAGQSLYRVWNFVPGINAETDGLEHYRSFNIGRCRAFRERFGEGGIEPHLPAASAVGINDPHLVVVFLTGRAPVSYFENPLQVPAYRYPEQYGPCSPSFARGAVVDHGPVGGRVGYLSGTASICGHETVGEGDVIKQLEMTMENIRLMMEKMGFSEALDPGSSVVSDFRVYLRNPADLETVRERFAAVVGEAVAKRVSYLKADVCRARLQLEIEGVFSDARVD